MPLVPTGLGGAFVDRIKTRVRDALGVENVAPTSQAPSQAQQVFTPGQPQQQGPQFQHQQPQDQSFSQRIKNRVRKELGLEPPQQQPQQPPPEPAYRGPPRSLAEVKQRIQEAARQMPPVLVRMLYNNNWRDAEVYSYRFRDKDKPHQPLLYAYCHKDNQIEAFKLDKIQDIQLTDKPYQPQWVVEI